MNAKRSNSIKSEAKKVVLVVTSTLPAHASDPVPAFVKDQLEAIKKQFSSKIAFEVLAPHDTYSRAKNRTQKEAYHEHRFHYFFPPLERLTGRGILPALKKNPLNYGLIPFLFIGEFFALMRLIRKVQPDLLYAHWFTPQAVVCSFAAKLTSTPFVFTTHAADAAVWRRLPFFGTKIVRASTRQAEYFTAVSKRSLAKLAYFFSDTEWQELSKRARIIPMGVTLPSIPPTQSERTPQTILFIGRLAEKKGVQYLLPAFATFVKQYPAARLVIAGDGPLLEELTQQAANLKIDAAVTFAGYVNGKKKQQLLARADVYVVPSIITDNGDAEGLPVSLMEGLAYGKICIATHESGADDILTHQKDGYLVPEKDPLALDEALRWAFSLPTAQRGVVMKAATKTAQQFAWPKIAKEYFEFLLQ